MQKEAAVPLPPSQHPLMPNCFQISNDHCETTVHSSVNGGTRGIIKIQKVSEKFTFGEHLKCIPGTGSVVTYIVIHRYRYSVPTIQKNLLPIIDLEEEKKEENTIRKGKQNTQASNFGLLDAFETWNFVHLCQLSPRNTDFLYKYSHALQVRNTQTAQLTGLVN